MTIDERLEKLTERHEALTQSVEVTVAENRERDRRMVEIMEAIARLVHVAGDSRAPHRAPGGPDIG
jgi:hypothetical protein